MTMRSGDAGATPTDIQHYAWLARSFGRTDYLLLSPEDLAAVGSAGTYVTKYPGTHLFRQGEAAQAAFVIQKGTVELRRETDDDSFAVARAGMGSVIGDIAMFRGEPYLQSARAVEPVTALRLDRDRLMPVLLQRPVIALRWLVAGLGQLERTQRRVLGLMRRSVLEQVTDLLHEEADKNGDVHLSQAAIAGLLGVSRQTVNEALAQLRGRGEVETGYGVIRLVGSSTSETESARPRAHI